MKNVSNEAAVKPVLSLPEFVTLMALMISLAALSTDAMLPAMPAIAHGLGVANEQDVHLIVSVFFAGLAFGQLFFGAYSDTRGRKEAILLGLATFFIGSIICVFAESMTAMLIGRVIQAFGVSGPRAVSLALVRDQYVGEEMARVMSFVMMVFIIVPMVAPVLGQTILIGFTWEYIFVFLMLICVINMLWFGVRQPETLTKERRNPFSWSKLFSSSKFIATHPPVIGPTLAMACVQGGFLAYLSASQTIFVDFYGVGPWFPAIFATLALSIGFSSYMNSRLIKRLGLPRLVHRALIFGIIAMSVFAIECIIYNGLPPMALVIATLMCGFFCLGLLFGNLNAMAMQPLGAMAGLGAALVGFISTFMAVPVALLIDSFVTDNLYPFAFGFAGFFTLAFIIMIVSRHHADKN